MTSFRRRRYREHRPAAFNGKKLMSHAVTLEQFFERLGSTNPFLENRVNGPAPAELDVADIHRAAFERLTGLAHHALAARCGLGAVLWGEAGIGKSHLLARLDRWAAANGAVFLYLHNLQAAPDALPRSLLRTVVGLLTNGRRSHFHHTPLYLLVRGSIIAAMGQTGRFDRADLERAYHRWLDQLGPAVGDRLVYQVLFDFFCSVTLAAGGRDDGAAAAFAVRWLSGGALDPAEAKALGLPPARHRDEPVALEDAQQIKLVLVAFSRLALARNKPFIVAIDQVDNLDEPQFAALTRFLEALLDTAVNLLVVTAGIQATLVEWRQRGAVQLSAWDRIAQTEVRLQRLAPQQASRLVRTRLDDFLAPFAGLDKVAQLRKEDDLFPLGKEWSEQNLLNRIEVRPRDAISAAREGWQQQQARLQQLGGEDWLVYWPGKDGQVPKRPWTAEERLAAIDREVEREMTAIRDRLHAEPGSLPSDADQLAGALNDVLERFCEPGYDLVSVQRIEPPRRNTAPTYHLSLRRRTAKGESVTGVLVMAEKAAVAVAAFLKRLRQNSQPLDRVVLATDKRIGLPLGDRGQEHLDALQARGSGQFTVIELSFAEQADLEALSEVLARARSGDVEIEPPGGPPEKIFQGDVIAAPSWRKRALEHRLIRELVAVTAGQPAAAAP
jgi:hypothetical protein